MNLVGSFSAGFSFRLIQICWIWKNNNRKVNKFEGKNCWFFKNSLFGESFDIFKEISPSIFQIWNFIQIYWTLDDQSWSRSLKTYIRHKGNIGKINITTLLTFCRCMEWFGYIEIFPFFRALNYIFVPPRRFQKCNKISPNVNISSTYFSKFEKWSLFGNFFCLEGFIIFFGL